MKLLLFILGLTCHYIVSAQVGAWTIVTPAQYHADPTITSVLQYGVTQFTGEEAAAGNIPDTTYTAGTIYSIYSQTASNGVNYRFDTSVNNDAGWILRATLILNYQTATNTTSLTSYVYVIQRQPATSASEEEALVSEEGGLAGGWSAVDVSELDTNEDLHNALNFGVQSVVDQGAQDHKLPESEWEIVQVFSIQEQVVAGMNYRFNVSIQNCGGVVATIVFEVYVPAGETGTDGMDATLDSLDFTHTPEGGLISGDCTGFNEEGETIFENNLNGETDLNDARMLFDLLFGH